MNKPNAVFKKEIINLKRPQIRTFRATDNVIGTVTKVYQCWYKLCYRTKDFTKLKNFNEIFGTG